MILQANMRLSRICQKFYKMIVRDHYFAAWVIAQGYRYAIIKADKTISLEISSTQFKALRKEWNAQHKPYFDSIRKLIKQLN